GTPGDWRAAVPTSNPVATGVWPHSFWLGNDNVCQRRRRTADEADRGADHSALGVSASACRQWDYQFSHPDVVRALHAVYALFFDYSDIADRWVFPLLAIHRPRYVDLCRCADTDDEQCQYTGQHGSTTLAQPGRQHRRNVAAY